MAVGVAVIAWQAWVTFAIAVLGAVLGIINTWQAIRRDRLRLRVRPLSVVGLSNARNGFGIEVINLSLFPVTVEEVGFTLNGKSAERGQRAMVVQPFTSDGGPWPRRLEPREVVTLYFDGADFRGNPGRIGTAYARTACREYAYGSTPALAGLREALWK